MGLRITDGSLTSFYDYPLGTSFTVSGQMTHVFVLDSVSLLNLTYIIARSAANGGFRVRCSDNIGNLSVSLSHTIVALGYTTNSAPIARIQNIPVPLFLAVVIDTSAPAGEKVRLYTGDALSPRDPLVAATFSSANDPSGSVESTAADPYVIFNNASLSGGFLGTIHQHACWSNRSLSLDEVQEARFNPRNVPGLTLLAYPGIDGVDRVFDFSGNGNHSNALTAQRTTAPVIPLDRAMSIPRWRSAGLVSVAAAAGVTRSFVPVGLGL